MGHIESPAKLAYQKHNEAQKQSPVALQKPQEMIPQAERLCNSQQAQKNLGSMLMQCFDGLKVYGKTPEQLENTTALFMLVLGEFSGDQITEAFKLYISRSAEIPTPADIVGIIRRGNKPPFSQAVYIRLEKKGHDARTFAEDAYMKDYEQYQVEG